MLSMIPLECGAIAAALSYFLFLFGERALIAAARRKLRIVVHVNGTRGKTETARLIAAAFRAGGIRTVCKSTGTLPFIVLPDGTERRVRRLGSPNVREQRNLLLLASRMRGIAETRLVILDARKILGDESLAIRQGED